MIEKDERRGKTELTVAELVKLVQGHARLLQDSA